MSFYKGGKNMKVVVIGSGDKAHGLANMYECNAHKNWCNLVFTEPLPREFTPFNDHVSVEPYPHAISDADIVILAIPSYAMENFLVQNFSLLKDTCILVDLTNETKDKKDLKGCLAALDITCDRWVKAFNDTGALQELQYHVTSKNKLSTNVCGPNEQCVDQIVEFAEKLGYEATSKPYDQYENLRGAQDTVGWEWKHASIFMIVMFLISFVYTTIHSSGRPYWKWYTLMCRHSSKMFGWTAIYGFAFSLLPGTGIRLIRLFSKAAPPKVLIWGCNIRKHVGLISLYFLFLHLCMMVLLFGEEYFGHFMESGALEWEGEASMLCAVISTSFFIITGISSLPSVSHAMNKAQFMFVFGPVVWGALALGLMHVMFLGVHSWTEEPKSPYAWARGMPPVTLMASIVPLIVIAIKFSQVVLTKVMYVKGRQVAADHPKKLVDYSARTYKADASARDAEQALANEETV